ncbi:hypothetical protein QR685DRAFT_112958 [Neurospora intermedia]|uniref:JmjC domain-containing protein n=1 Tax=Neurospora intermedia TaxID=5142 RepID=A0ABR3CZT6_NEUIN
MTEMSFILNPISTSPNLNKKPMEWYANAPMIPNNIHGILKLGGTITSSYHYDAEQGQVACLHHTSRHVRPGMTISRGSRRRSIPSTASDVTSGSCCFIIHSGFVRISWFSSSEVLWSVNCLMAALQGHGCVHAWLVKELQARQLTQLVIGSVDRSPSAPVWHLIDLVVVTRCAVIGVSYKLPLENQGQFDGRLIFENTSLYPSQHLWLHMEDHYLRILSGSRYRRSMRASVG